MKNRIASFLLFTFCGISFSLTAQTKHHPIDSKLKASTANYALKTIKLSTGVQLQYAEQGDAEGEPVIFLHGITDSWHSYEKVLPLLPSSIHAFALSQRGHGDSERPLTGYTPKDFAGDVAAFIKQLNLKSAIIVGHSMSGMIVQQFALDYPELIRAIVINSSAAYIKDNPGLPEFYNQVMQLNDPMDRAFMDEFQKATLIKPIDPGYFNLLVTEGMKVPVRVFKAALTGLMEADYRKELKKIKVPVLIMWGAKDGFFPETNQQLLLGGISGSKLVIYEGTGHALHWEEPVRFTNDLLNFINKSL